MQLRDEQIIDKIISECRELLVLTEGYSQETFIEDERTKRAVSMTLINIGELVKTLSDEVRNENNHIPWRLIAGFRDVAAHRYQTLTMEDVWKTADEDIPELLENLLKLHG